MKTLAIEIRDTLAAALILATWAGAFQMLHFIWG